MTGGVPPHFRTPPYLPLTQAIGVHELGAPLRWMARLGNPWPYQGQKQTPTRWCPKSWTFVNATHLAGFISPTTHSSGGSISRLFFLWPYGDFCSSKVHITKEGYHLVWFTWKILGPSDHLGTVFWRTAWDLAIPQSVSLKRFFFWTKKAFGGVFVKPTIL